MNLWNKAIYTIVLSLMQFLQFLYSFSWLFISYQEMNNKYFSFQDNLILWTQNVFFFFFKNKIMEIFVKTVYTCTYIHYQRFSCIAEKPNISHNLTRNTGLNTHHSTWCCSVQLTIHVHSILYTNPSILNCLYMTACIKCLIINFHEISL